MLCCSILYWYTVYEGLLYDIYHPVICYQHAFAILLHISQGNICLFYQATASLQAASTVAAVTEAQKLLESLSWEGGYCPFSQPLSALNAHALLRLHR